jgi:hypothetical protein
MEVLRIRHIFNHSSTCDRLITEELTLRNDEDINLSQIILPINKFMVGLHIYNADDYELPILTKEKIREIISEKYTEEEFKQFDKDYLEGKSIIWIDLPSHLEIESGETRIIKLVYRDEKTVPRYLKSLLHMPHYKEVGSINQKCVCDIFYYIECSPDYVISFNQSEGLGIPKQYKNITERYVYLRLPYRAGVYDYSFDYKIKIPKLEELFWSSILIGLFAITILSMLNYSKTWQIFPPTLDRYIIPTSVVSISLAIASFVKEPIILRIKILTLVPIILNLIMLIL